jgi:hypothetical protein
MSAPWVGAFVALWILVLLIAFLLLGFLRRMTELLAAVQTRLNDPLFFEGLQGLMPGTVLPHFEARDERGVLVNSDALELPGILLLVDPGCEPCERLVAEIADSTHAFPGIQLYLITADSQPGREINLGAGTVTLYQRDGGVSRALRSSLTPQAFGVDRRRVVVGRQIPQSIVDLGQLARRVTEGGETPSGGDFVRESARAR